MNITLQDAASITCQRQASGTMNGVRRGYWPEMLLGHSYKLFTRFGEDCALIVESRSRRGSAHLGQQDSITLHQSVKAGSIQLPTWLCAASNATN